jgi:hypothetical protein
MIIYNFRKARSFPVDTSLINSISLKESGINWLIRTKLKVIKFKTYLNTVHNLLISFPHSEMFSLNIVI